MMTADEALRELRATVGGWQAMHHGGREVGAVLLMCAMTIERELVELRAKVRDQEKESEREP